jgi:hypothetical protein
MNGGLDDRAHDVAASGVWDPCVGMGGCGPVHVTNMFSHDTGRSGRISAETWY